MKKKGDIIKEEESDQMDSNNEQYRCGDENCGKIYHSYTAFYNHCKKSHDG